MMLNTKTKILIVDDMLMMRKALVKFCRSLGFSDVSEAPGGIEAWRKISTSNPPFDLIISDWNMPEGSGLDLLKQVRGDQRLSTTPMILVTSEKEKAQIEEAFQAGATDYITKPFSVNSFKAKLDRILGQSAA